MKHETDIYGVECWSRPKAPCPFEVVKVCATDQTDAEKEAAKKMAGTRFSARFVAYPAPLRYYER